MNALTLARVPADLPPGAPASCRPAGQNPGAPASCRPARRPARMIKEGSATVQIFGQGPYTIAWRESAGGPRLRLKRAGWKKAEGEARRIAVNLANGQIAQNSFTETDRARWRTCLEQAAPSGLAPELLVTQGVELHRILGDASPIEAAKFFVANQGTKVVRHKPCPEIYNEMLAAREKDGSSPNTLDDLKSRCGRFAKDFPVPIMSIGSADLSKWLRTLPNVKRRTRNNYRGALIEFYRFAREAGYVPKTWSPLDEVPKLKNETVRIEIFTPEEAVKLLAAARNRDLRNRRNKPVTPYLAVAFFSGARHEEISNGKNLPVIDWRQVDFDKNEIHVLADVARKKGYDRLTPMQPNLRAWLLPYRKNNGPLCDLANMTNVLAGLAEAAAVPWKDNGPRKSFISYRLAITDNIGTVAQEAGTSPDRIRQNYKKTVPKREANRWFEIWPTNAAILQLPLAL